jgi:hypothetical protein
MYLSISSEAFCLSHLPPVLERFLVAIVPGGEAQMGLSFLVGLSLRCS